jgi:hypothetical protein
MSDPADRAGCSDGLSGQERDAMVASLLGITPDRLRTMRRLQSKRAPGDARFVRPHRWQAVDQLDDGDLFDAVRRREVRARAVASPRFASPVDRTGRRATGLR